jgi:uridine kinase
MHPMKLPILRWDELLARIKEALTPNRLPLLIVVDGADGSGKTSLASWLAWQLGAPTVHLDLYLAALEPIVQWRSDDLTRAVSSRLDKRRPVIVEGVLALDALDLIKRKADFLVFVKGVGGRKMASQIAAYCLRRNLPQSAQFTIDGYVE